MLQPDNISGKGTTLGFIRLKLKKQGFVRGCVKALIKKSFTPEAANDASLARMYRVTGCIISGAEIRRGDITARWIPAELSTA